MSLEKAALKASGLGANRNKSDRCGAPASVYVNYLVSLASRDAATGVARNGVTVLLENTAGSGAQIGGPFEELRALADVPEASARIPAICWHANIGEGYIGKAGFRRILATAAAIWKT